MFSEYRLVGMTIACIVFLFGIAPLPATIILALIIVAILFFKYYVPLKTASNGSIARREEALRIAKVYLAPYEDIWRDLKLSNPFCYLTLSIDGMTIEGFEISKGGTYRTFKVLKSNVHDWEDLWNLFCKNFTYNKSYDGLLEDCRRFNLVVEEKLYENPVQTALLDMQPATKKVDINNCSEAEMANLPGVSIIMAKKAIKVRIESGGFDSIEDFYKLLNIKPNMQQQLSNIIYLGKKSGVITNKRFSERRIDF